MIPPHVGGESLVLDPYKDFLIRIKDGIVISVNAEREKDFYRCILQDSSFSDDDRNIRAIFAENSGDFSLAMKELAAYVATLNDPVGRRMIPDYLENTIRHLKEVYFPEMAEAIPDSQTEMLKLLQRYSDVTVEPVEPRIDVQSLKPNSLYRWPEDFLSANQK